jgi:hypothetical protein
MGYRDGNDYRACRAYRITFIMILKSASSKIHKIQKRTLCPKLDRRIQTVTPARGTTTSASRKRVLSTCKCALSPLQKLGSEVGILSDVRFHAGRYSASMLFRFRRQGGRRCTAMTLLRWCMWNTRGRRSRPIAMPGNIRVSRSGHRERCAKCCGAPGRNRIDNKQPAQTEGGGLAGPSFVVDLATTIRRGDQPD